MRQLRRAKKVVSLLWACAVAACAPGPKPGSEKGLPTNWRLVPETTVLGERRQHYLMGEKLEAAQLEFHPSVSWERGDLSNRGKALSLYIQVESADLPLDPKGKADAVGIRYLRVVLPDTSLTVPLRIADERLP